MSEPGGRVVVADVVSEFLEVAIHMILFIRGIYPPELFESTQKYNCPLKTARHPGLISYIQQIVQSIRAELQRNSIHRICIVTLDPAGKAIDRFVFEMSMLRAFEERLPAGNGPQSDNAIKGRVDKGKGKAIHNRQNIRNRGEGADGTESYNNDQFGDSEGIAEEEETLYRTSARDRTHRQQQQQRQQGTGFEGTMQLTTDIEMMFRAMLLKISVCDSYFEPLVQDCSFTVLIEMKAAGTGPEAKVDFPWSPISDAVQADRSKLSFSPTRPSPNRKIIPVKTIALADIQLELFIEQLES